MKSRKKKKAVKENVTFAIDDRAYSCLPSGCRAVVGFVDRDTNPPDNIAFFYRKEDDSFYLRVGPYQTGHWGHDSSGNVIPRATFLSEEYWKTVRLPRVVVRKIHEFLLKEGFVEKPPPYTKDPWLSSRTESSQPMKPRTKKQATHQPKLKFGFVDSRAAIDGVPTGAKLKGRSR